MREILFRGKGRDDGEWAEGFLYITHDGEYEISRYLRKFDIERWTRVVIPNTVGQFTGLKDKNGKKIFEGDIVALNSKYTKEPIIGVITYGHFADYSYKNGYGDEHLGWHIIAKRRGLFSIPPKSKNIQIDVLGNMFDNTELLY